MANPDVTSDTVTSPKVMLEESVKSDVSSGICYRFVKPSNTTLGLNLLRFVINDVSSKGQIEEDLQIQHRSTHS